MIHESSPTRSQEPLPTGVDGVTDYLYPVDLERFWRDNDASLDKPFSTDKPQVPMTLRTTEGCLWQELGLEPDPRYYEDPEIHIRLNKLYNDKAEEIVGRRILRETFVPPEHQLPRPLRIEEIFGSHIRTVPGSEELDSADWVVESIHSIRELEERMEYVRSLKLEDIVFPEGFFPALQRLRTVIHGQLPPFTFSRGTPQEIAEAVRRDIEAVGADGGLVVTTAGSVNPGSKLAGLRAVMYAIQTWGRYQPFS